jgi:hypothetical protein
LEGSRCDKNVLVPRALRCCQAMRC